MKLTLTLSILFVILQTSLSAQGYNFYAPGRQAFPGTITYVNGKVKTGLIIAPKHLKQSKIFYRTAKKAKKEKIPSNLIASISLQTETGKDAEFEFLPSVMKKGKTPGSNIWLEVIVKGYATLYLISDKYLLSEDGHVYNFDNASSGPSWRYYLRKKGEKVATFFAYTSPSKMVPRLNSILKDNAAIYLSEDTDLLKRIENKELTHKDLEEIIRIYNDYMVTAQ